MTDLDVLIPSLSSRADTLKKLCDHIKSISKKYNVHVITLVDNGKMSTGEKRNKLIAMATSPYIMFVDDDDDLHEQAFIWIFAALKDKPDCVELKGIYTDDGRNPQEFHHSIEYKTYSQTPKLTRPPNHLNPMKTSIARAYKFERWRRGEDTDWALRLAKANAFKTMGKVPKPWYFYKYFHKKGDNERH